MTRCRLSRQARADLDDIWLYVARNRGEETADSLIDVITDRFLMLAAMPGSGRKRGEILPGLRSHPVGNYVIFYRQRRNWVEIIRVLHGARDIGRTLGS